MSSFVAVEISQKLNEIKKLHKYCIEKFPSEKPSKKSHVYFDNFLKTMFIDLTMAILYYENKIKGFSSNNLIRNQYCRHIIRSFIIESFSLTENRLLEICNERKISVKGKNDRLYNLISEARNITKNEEVKKCLKKALKNIGPPEYVEFQTRLSALLKMQPEKIQTEWEGFFKGFPQLRNCMHTNFIPTKEFIWNQRKFLADKPVSIDLNKDLPFILDGLTKFFDLVE